MTLNSIAEKGLLPRLSRNEFLKAVDAAAGYCLDPELQLWRPRVRRGSFGCGLRPLIWTCDITKFSDIFGAVHGVGCVRNSKGGASAAVLSRN